MLRRHRQVQMQIHQLMDACLFAISFWLAYVLRSEPRVIYHFSLAPVGPFDAYVWLYVSMFLFPAAPMVLEAQGFYNRPMMWRRRTTAWQLLKACVILTLCLVLGLFLFRTYSSRGVVIGFGIISFLLVYLKEELVRLGYTSKLAREQYRRRFILIGTGEETRKIKAELRAKSDEELEILAELDLEKGGIQRLVDLLHEHSVNGVILSTRGASFEQVEEAILSCELEGVEAWVLADFFKTQLSRSAFDDLYGRPVLVFRTTPEASLQSLLKPVLDFVVALLVVVVASPIWLLLALMVKLSSPGPIFFRQWRAGLNGKPFRMFKFRTMVSNAEQLKEGLASRNEMSGPVFKLSKDPRVTTVGRLFRKFSIDEFPQLLNVLRGEMSLVGPRPLPVDEVKRFNELAHRRRLSVKPGLTCLWQVEGRNDVTDFDDWVRLDLEYIDNWSLWLDLKILFRTIPVVLTGKGAR